MTPTPRLLTRYGLFMGQSCARIVGRFASRRLNVARFLFHQAGLGGSVRLGANILLRNPHLIHCATGVSIGDAAELMVEPASGDTASSITLGRSVKIGKRCQLAASPGTIAIEDFASIHTGTYLLGNVYVGRYSLLSVNVFASSGDHHPFDTPHMLIRDQDHAARRAPQKSNHAVVIEEDCWIGWGAAIKKGVHIGRGAVVGANAVVTQDVPPYTVVGGTPARPIRARFAFVPPPRIAAEREEHGPYLYRGFLHSAPEKEALGLPCAGAVAALPQALLVLEQPTHAALALQLSGTTLVGNVTLTVRSGTQAGSVTLPHAAAFEVVIALAETAEPPPPLGKPAPKLPQGHSITILSTAAAQPSGCALEPSPLWALRTAGWVGATTA